MPNQFYNAPSSNIPLTRVRSANENTDRLAVEAGFDRIPAPDDLYRNLYGIDESAAATLYEITVPYLAGDYVQGQELTFEALFSNTGPANIQVNGGAIVELVDTAGAALSAGIIGSGQMIKAIYTSNNRFRLLNVVNVGSAAVDQTANYNWSGIHDFSLATVIGVQTDLAAAYAWTGQHDFSVIPNINMDPIFHQANIKQAVLEIYTETGATYLATIDRINTLVLMDNASANTYQIPDDATTDFPVGTVLSLAQFNAGETTIAGLNGNVTLLSEIGLVINAQYGFATAVKTAPNTWLLSGSLKA